MPRLHDTPILIGLVGDSAAGKSTMAAGLADVLGPERCVVISMDDYIRHPRNVRSELGITAHDPVGNYMDILEQHIALLREGQPILKPVYNHNGGRLEAPEYVQPREFIILEGLLGYTTPTLRDAYDVKFYLEPQEPLRLRWKFQRDTTAGGYSVEQVMASLDRLNRDSALYVLPQRVYADMVISFYPPEDRPDETGARLNVRHLLRPTLPQINVAGLLDGAPAQGFELELARDVDGRPADALHIYGTIPPGEAESMQEYLWRTVANGRNDHPRLGAYRDARNEVQYSAPLALSQLLLTQYLLNAAPGRYAH
jgi:phosphoribulokinase